MIEKKIKLLIICLFAGLLLTGCGAKKHVPSQPPAGQKELADLQNFPQNLAVFANQDKPDHRLISAEQQQQRTEKFEQTYFGPWQMRKTSVRKKDVSVFFRNARGYKKGSENWTQDEWNEFALNANAGAFPSLAMPGITTRQTDLRELPTHETRTDKPDVTMREYPFDYFQYSLLPAGMPLLIAHVSRDQGWYYIECPIASGWVDAKDVAIAGEDFRHTYQSGKYAAITGENIKLPNGTRASIGAVFPLANPNSAGSLEVYLPVKGKDGTAACEKAVLMPGDAVLQPMPLTPANVAKLGDKIMGQKYGWGGTNGDRDCSALMRDLFAPFGIWLPRNSAPQARRGYVIPLAGLNPAQKNEVILKEGVPFLALLGLNGHIGLYVGNWKGKAAIFHNAWGLRIIRDGNDNERYVIGKTVITSIDPGRELPELYTTRTFADRIHSLTIL